MTARTERLELSCTLEEKALLEQAAANAGIETGAWVVARALDAARRKKHPCHPQCIRPDDHVGGCWIQLLDW